MTVSFDVYYQCEGSCGEYFADITVTDSETGKLYYSSDAKTSELNQPEDHNFSKGTPCRRRRNGDKARHADRCRCGKQGVEPVNAFSVRRRNRQAQKNRSQQDYRRKSQHHNPLRRGMPFIFALFFGHRSSYSAALFSASLL